MESPVGPLDEVTFTSVGEIPASAGPIESLEEKKVKCVDEIAFAFVRQQFLSCIVKRRDGINILIDAPNEFSKTLRYPFGLVNERSDACKRIWSDVCNDRDVLVFLFLSFFLLTFIFFVRLFDILAILRKALWIGWMVGDVLKACGHLKRAETRCARTSSTMNGHQHLGPMISKLPSRILQQINVVTGTWMEVSHFKIMSLTTMKTSSTQ